MGGPAEKIKAASVLNPEVNASVISLSGWTEADLKTPDWASASVMRGDHEWSLAGFQARVLPSLFLTEFSLIWQCVTCVFPETFSFALNIKNVDLAAVMLQQPGRSEGQFSMNE